MPDRVQRRRPCDWACALALLLRVPRSVRRLLGGLVLALVVLAIALFVILQAQSPAASPTPSASPTPIPLDQALLNRRVTFLLLGTDQNAARKARGEVPLTDAMIVMSVNAKHTRVTMISLPRDTVDVPLPDGSVWHSKLNALYSAKGVDTLKKAIENLFAATIDFTILVNMDDLVSIVNAFGGVDVTVAKPIADPTIGLNIKAGRQHLDGKTALLYSRSRHTTNDFERAARQQQVLFALLAKFNAGKKIDVLGLLKGLSGLKTDVPDDKLPTLAEIARRSKKATLNSQVLQPPRFYAVASDPVRGYILEPRLDAIRSFTQPLLSGP
jgi:LCP family protein required for cell wall assembly